jgi:hypothetical protein
MDDITTRLKAWKDERGFPTPGEMMDEAAAEIERLRGYRDEAESQAGIASLALARMRLTDEERDAIWTVAEAYAENDGDPDCERIARIMQGLWQRTK